MTKFSFKPKSEAEFQEEQREREEAFLWEAGEYAFEITKATAKTSKEKFDAEGNYKSGGKPMIELKVNIYKDNGTFQSIFDYLQADGTFAFKLRHMAYACGLGSDYEAGMLDPSDLEGKQGMAKVGIQKASGDYPARNSIGDYIVPEEAAAQATKAKTEKAQKEAPVFDDGIPF